MIIRYTTVSSYAFLDPTPLIPISSQFPFRFSAFPFHLPFLGQYIATCVYMYTHAYLYYDPYDAGPRKGTLNFREATMPAQSILPWTINLKPTP